MNYKNLANYLLDALIDLTSPTEVAEDLFYNGDFSADELDELGFDDELIEEFRKIEKERLDDSMDAPYEKSRDDLDWYELQTVFLY